MLLSMLFTPDNEEIFCLQRRARSQQAPITDIRSPHFCPIAVRLFAILSTLVAARPIVSANNSSYPETTRHRRKTAIPGDDRPEKSQRFFGPTVFFRQFNNASAFTQVRSRAHLLRRSRVQPVLEMDAT